MQKLTRKYALDFSKKEMQYILNDLAFKSESEIKESILITDILLPTKTMENKANPNREYLWNRYLQGATWHSYPRQFLEKIIGLASKGYPATTGYDGEMQRFFEYCSMDGTNLINVQMNVMTDIIKFGSCALLILIPDDVTVYNAPLKVDVIPGCDVLDGTEKRFIWKEEKDIFDEKTKIYKRKIFLHVEALDYNGIYYSALMDERQYAAWDLDFPDERKCISLKYPQMAFYLTEIPVVYCNATDLSLKWEDAYAQPIIDLTWHIFALDADNNYALHQQSTAHLMIKGVSDPEQTYPLGLGAVHVFKENDVDEKYIAPQTSGIDLQMKKLTEIKENAQDMLMNLVSSKNASGEALKLYIGDKTNGLIGMIKNVGNAIQVISEKAAVLLGMNPDDIEYIPYIDFFQNEEVNTIEEVENTTSPDSVNQENNEKE